MSERPWSGRQLHFVGLGGAGMSGLAIVARALGAEVTGSDRAPDSPYLAHSGLTAVPHARGFTADRSGRRANARRKRASKPTSSPARLGKRMLAFKDRRSRRRCWATR